MLKTQIQKNICFFAATEPRLRRKPSQLCAKSSSSTLAGALRWLRPALPSNQKTWQLLLVCFSAFAVWRTCRAAKQSKTGRVRKNWLENSNTPVSISWSIMPRCWIKSSKSEWSFSVMQRSCIHQALSERVTHISLVIRTFHKTSSHVTVDKAAGMLLSRNYKPEPFQTSWMMLSACTESKCLCHILRQTLQCLEHSKAVRTNTNSASVTSSGGNSLIYCNLLQGFLIVSSFLIRIRIIRKMATSWWSVAHGFTMTISTTYSI